MPLVEASAIRTAVVLPHAPAEDRAGLRQLALWCDGFSPFVALEEATFPECLLLDVRGSAPLFGGETGLLCELEDALRSQRLIARMAVADTVGAAWAAAHFAPDPVAVIPAGWQQPTLEPWSIHSLRLPSTAAERLHDLGIQSVGQLLALPRSSISARFGAETLRRIDQALGRIAELLCPEQPREPLAAVWSSEEPLGNRPRIEAVLKRLLDPLLSLLASRQEGVRQLRCEFHGSGQEAPICLTVGLLRPSTSPEQMHELLRLQLEKTPLAAEVTTIRIEATATERLSCRQHALFENGTAPDRDRELAAFVERLSSRLGEDAVLRARLRPEAQPELACRNEPALRASSRLPRLAPPNTALFRPLWLHPRPARVDVISVYPDGPPQRLTCQGRNYRLPWVWGPERIETGWWRGRTIRRDYYRVETDTGQRFWLFRRIEPGDWFLHGTFE